jgi:hypothetical protein
MMSARTAVLAGRRAAERLMVDSCTIRRVTSSATDPETGVVTATYLTVYNGKCRVQQKIPVSKPGDVGQAAVWLQRLELQVPMAATGIQSNDLATVTASVLDPDLLNRTWHVRELGHKTHATSRRVQIEEITG